MINKGIVVIVTQGFANRMRMINSCYSYSKILNVKLFVVWLKTEDCFIEYQDVFSENKNNNFSQINLEDVKKESYLYFGRVHTQNYLDKIDLAYKDINKQFEYLILEGGHEFKHNSISRLEFIHGKKNFYRSLKFNSNIENELKKNLDKKDYFTSENQTKSSIKSNYKIAIHYRDIDKYDDLDISNNKLVNFVKNSPIDNFCKFIDLISDKHKILLVSNSNKMYETLKEKYPNRDFKFIMNLSNENRGTNNGMIKSIVDFLLLSYSDLIIGNYFSSFSDEASFYNLAPKITPLSSELLNNIKDTVNNYHCINYSFIDNIAALNYNDQVFSRYLSL